MMRLRFVFLLLLTLFAASTGHAVTVCSVSCDNHVDNSGVIQNGSPTAIVLIGSPGRIDIGSTSSYDLTLFADGDLYLDYSAYDSADQALTLIAPKIELYNRDAVIDLPDSYFSTESTLLGQRFVSGTWLISDSQSYSSASFEATGSIYVGNFATAVPLPPAAMLFGSALLMALLGRHRQVHQPS